MKKERDPIYKRTTINKNNAIKLNEHRIISWTISNVFRMVERIWFKSVKLQPSAEGIQIEANGSLL